MVSRFRALANTSADTPENNRPPAVIVRPGTTGLPDDRRSDPAIQMPIFAE